LADIFVSYSSKDLHRVEPIVGHLEAAGFSVWWDRQIQGGTMFSKKIEAEVEKAQVVLVVWSASSLESRWVADEVDLALQTGKLVPIRIDGVNAPMGFRQIQTIDFSGWAGGTEEPCVETLMEAIGHHMSDSENASGPARRRTEPVAEASIAVLPFADMSPDKDQEYFTDGISEELLNLLSKIPQMQVTARTSSFAFKGTDKQLSEIGEILGVAHILEGSMRKSGNRVRITAQLIKTATDFHVWSETFDRTLDDIFAIQDEIAAAIVSALKEHILGDVATPETDQSKNIEAYDLYLRGQQLITTRLRASLEEGRQCFEEALALDPKYVPALVGLADAHLLLSNGSGCYGTTPLKEALDVAMPLLNLAIELKPDSDEAFAVRSMAYQLGENFDASIADAKTAVEINPNFARAYRMLSHSFLVSGDPYALTVSTREKAIQLDPLSVVDLSNHAMEIADRGRLKEAREIYTAMAERDPDQRFSEMGGVVLSLLDGTFKNGLELYKGNERLRHGGNGQWGLQFILGTFNFGKAVEKLDLSQMLGIYSYLGQAVDADRIGPDVAASCPTPLSVYDAFTLAAWHSLSGRHDKVLELTSPFIEEDSDRWGPLFDSQLDFIGARLGYLAARELGDKDTLAYFEGKLRVLCTALLQDPYGVHHNASYIGAIVALMDDDTEKALDFVEDKVARTPVLAIEMANDLTLASLSSEPRFIAAMEISRSRIAAEKLAAFEAGLLPPGPEITG
jgi:TolB-like protein